MATSSSSQPAPTNKLQSLNQSVHKFLHQKNAFTSVLEQIEQLTKVKREYMFYGKKFWSEVVFSLNLIYIIELK